MRGETVILFHGLGRTPISMALLARQLEAKGWRTERPRYPSTDLSLEEAVEHVAGSVLARRRTRRLHLAGHSLGGLLAFLIAGKLPPDNLGRVVQIGSPNTGSAAAVLAAEIPGVPWMMGPVLEDLAPHEADPPPPFELGCIAGDLPLVPVAHIAGEREPNDGLVSVDSAIHPGATDSIVLSSAHPLLPFDPRVARQVDAFLRTGRFRHETL